VRSPDFAVGSLEHNHLPLDKLRDSRPAPLPAPDQLTLIPLISNQSTLTLSILEIR
jgi:hypothetical protein